MKNIVPVTAIVFVLHLSLTVEAQTPLWQGKGRIVLSSDGNHHDHDDWAATALACAMIAAKDLQDKLVLYTYSDHVWGSRTTNNKHGMNSYEHMKESALGAKKRFGFENSKFLCAVDDPEAAYDAVAEEINKSSEENPLFICAGGPMHVVGEGIMRSQLDKRKYVTLISHAEWNNKHADNPGSNEPAHEGWTFQEIKETFEAAENGGVTLIKIKNQNSGKDYEGLKVPKERYDWMLSSKASNLELYQDGAWDWLYSRMKTSVKGAKGEEFDPSDAGMVIFLLTGIEKTNPDMVKSILENPVER